MHRARPLQIFLCLFITPPPFAIIWKFAINLFRKKNPDSYIFDLRLILRAALSFFHCLHMLNTVSYHWLSFQMAFQMLAQWARVQKLAQWSVVCVRGAIVWSIRNLPKDPFFLRCWRGCVWKMALHHWLAAGKDGKEAVGRA